MSTSNFILYSRWRSSCSYRVRIALHLKNFPYDIETIDSNSESFHEYAAISPTKYIPALRAGLLNQLISSIIGVSFSWVFIFADGHIFIESIAIMHYLDEAYPNSYQLLPKDVIKRCKVREISEVIGSGIQPLQNTGVLLYLDEAERREWAKHWITRGFLAVEKLLSSSAGKFCVGDEITMADCCLLPQVYGARR